MPNEGSTSSSATDQGTRGRRAVVTLPNDKQILITREFDAPRHLVFRAWTTPDLIKRWWSGDRGVVEVAEVDLRVGGTWRYAMVANGGFPVAFRGEYLEIVPNELIVNTEIFEAIGGPGALVRNTFAEVEGRTVLSMLVTHTTTEGRDLHINSGMEGGMQEAMDHLEQVALSLG